MDDMYIIEKGQIFGSHDLIKTWNRNHVSQNSFKGSFVYLGYFSYRFTTSYYYRCTSNTCLVPVTTYTKLIYPVAAPTEEGMTAETTFKNESSKETIVKTNLGFGDKVVLSKRCKTYFDSGVRQDKTDDLSYACINKHGCYFHAHIPPGNEVVITKIS